MMISRNKAPIWANIPVPLKERLEALRAIDPVIYSESRVVWKCLELSLPVVEQEAHRFKRPLHKAHRKTFNSV